jgi:plastocyanin
LRRVYPQGRAAGLQGRPPLRAARGLRLTEQQRPLARIAVIAVAVVVVAFAGLVLYGVTLGGRSDTDVAETPTVITAGQFTIDISDFEYVPSNVSVPAGAEVTWVNRDSTRHDAVADGDEWESEALNEDDTDTLSFETPGDYPYHCSFHPYMKAILTVRAPED